MVDINDPELNDVRRQINQVDNQILSLMEARFELIKKVAEIKKNKGLPIRDLEREKEIILSKIQKSDLPEEFISALYRLIIDTNAGMEEQEHERQ